MEGRRKASVRRRRGCEACREERGEVGYRVSAPWHERWGRATRARASLRCDVSRGCAIEVRESAGDSALRLRRARVDEDNVDPSHGSASEIARLVPVNIRAVVVSKTHRRRWWWNPRCWRSHRRRRGRAWRRGQHRQPAKRRKWGVRRSAYAVGRSLDRRKSNTAEGYFFPVRCIVARGASPPRATRENVNARAQIVLNPRSHSNPGSVRGGSRVRRRHLR